MKRLSTFMHAGSWLWLGLAVGCGTADPNGSSLAARKDAGSASSESSSDDTSSSKGSDTSTTSKNDDTDRKPDGMDGTGTPGSSGPDGDGDGFPDDIDCDPASKAIAGAKVLDDTLASDKGFFTVADGFPAASWTFADGYVQNRVENASDATFFNKDAAITDVSIEVKAISTKLANTTPLLRQMFILVGASVSGGSLTAAGCGLEVDGSETHSQKTSVLKFSGPTNNVTSTVVNRVDRGVVQAGEEFGFKATLTGGTLKCEVTQANGTTVAAGNVGATPGSVGFFVRQTGALFKNAKICKMK